MSKEGSMPWVPHRPERPVKSEGGRKFVLKSDYNAAGDQPQAIKQLVSRVLLGDRDQVLLGVTGSGKTYTMARVIEDLQKPSLVIAPNKTLAAQLYEEFCQFFPENAVEYFVSYYDYYQPEAYVPRTDTFIEKESSINERIDRMRHSATRALLEYDDVIIISSVSCIYGIGSVEGYSSMAVELEVDQYLILKDLIKKLVEMQYNRNDMAFVRGSFRKRGDTIDIWPSHLESIAWRVSYFGDTIEEIKEFNCLTGEVVRYIDKCKIYANSHYVTPRPTLDQARIGIARELEERVKELQENGQLLEAQRLEQRTRFDLETLAVTGSCAGIENYSRYLTGRGKGEPPPNLFEYLPQHGLVFVDESHVTIGQLKGMYRGDYVRKTTLAEYGFRLPSCIDNRPLKYEEWDVIRPQTVYVSATPGEVELEKTQGVFVEQVIRPTGLVDPKVDIHPAVTQVDDLYDNLVRTTKAGYRSLVTTLTKRMAEDLTEYLDEIGIKVRYMHSDIDTLERIEIIKALREGEFDVLVGINLLREGLDIPECAFVGILDADKEGFLRSTRSLIQTIGRAARNVDSRVILYADKITNSMQEAINETERRRKIQLEYNETNGITPRTVKRGIVGLNFQLSQNKNEEVKHNEIVSRVDLSKKLRKIETEMLEAASNLEFEKAAKLRDKIKSLKKGSV